MLLGPTLELGSVVDASLLLRYDSLPSARRGEYDVNLKLK